MSQPVVSHQAAIPYSPDLAANTVVISVDHIARTVKFAALIQNVGLGTASGPFEIDMAVTLYRGGVTTSYFQTFLVPAGVTLGGRRALAEPDLSVTMHMLDRSGVVVHNPMSNTYLAAPMELPLYYGDENPSARYRIDYLVDAEYQISDPNRVNNIFSQPWFTSTPEAVGRLAPFVAESSYPVPA